MYKNNKCYISGQITGLEESVYLEIFETAKNRLLEKGYEPISPIDLRHDHDKSWEEYMKVDIAALMECSFILGLPNWIYSKGAKIELKLADDLKISTVNILNLAFAPEYKVLSLDYFTSMYNPQIDQFPQFKRRI